MLRLTKKQNIIYIKKLRKQQWKTQKKGRNELSSQIVFFPLWYTGWAIVNYCTPYIYHLFSRQKKKKTKLESFFFFFLNYQWFFLSTFFSRFQVTPSSLQKCFIYHFQACWVLICPRSFKVTMLIQFNRDLIFFFSKFVFLRNWSLKKNEKKKKTRPTHKVTMLIQFQSWSIFFFQNLSHAANIKIIQAITHTTNVPQ